MNDEWGNERMMQWKMKSVKECGLHWANQNEDEGMKRRKYEWICWKMMGNQGIEWKSEEKEGMKREKKEMKRKEWRERKNDDKNKEKRKKKKRMME